MRTGIIALSLLLAGWAPAFAQSRTAASAGQQFAWQAGPPILPKGAQMTVISGDPAKEGPYAIRLKLPNNYVIPPHQHPTRAEITVLYGAYYLGIGDKLNKRRGKLLERGAITTIPAQTDHYAWTGSETVIQVKGTGPFTMTYVDPADDPSKPPVQPTDKPEAPPSN